MWVTNRLSQGRRMAAGNGRGHPSIRVAVLDGPVDLSHPSLIGASLSQEISAASTDVAMTAHGTHVASIIFGQPDTVMTGLAPRCTGISIPIYRDAGNACLQIDLTRALLLAIAHEAHVVNLSGGAASADGQAEPFLLDALAKCEAAGVLVIAAAGNDGRDCVHVPAAIPTVLAVGAADLTGRPLDMSNWGSAYAANGILAPGQDIPGADAGGSVAHRTGTSFAAAFVSGIAALMLSEQVERGERPDPLAVRAALLAGALPLDMHGARGLAGGLNLSSSIKTLNMGEANMNDASNDVSAYRVSEAGGGPSESATVRVMPAGAPSDAVKPSDCGCGCGGKCGGNGDCGCGHAAAKANQSPQYVYPLGRIGYDFGTETRRDSILQFVERGGDLSPAGILEHFRTNPEDVERVIWTLELDGSPIYALQPVGANADRGFAKLVDALADQVAFDRRDDPEIARQSERRPTGLFAIPGVLAGEVRLMSGQIVPVIAMSVRAPIAWDLDSAVEKLIAKFEEQAKSATKKESDDIMKRIEGIRGRLPGYLSDFSDMMLRRYRNLGLLGSERALNYSATSAVRVLQVLDQIEGAALVLDDIEVLPSPASRPGAICHDVRLRLFQRADTTAPLHIFQFTVDVNDALPVSIGTVAHWRERPTR